MNVMVLRDASARPALIVIFRGLPSTGMPGRVAGGVTLNTYGPACGSNKTACKHCLSKLNKLRCAGTEDALLVQQRIRHTSRLCMQSDQ